MRQQRRRDEEQGSVIVEFALIVPLLFALFFGTIQYGYQFWALQTASANAREVARRLIVGTEVQCTIAEAVDRASGPAVGTDPVQVTYRYHHQDGSLATQARGVLVTVTVRFQSLDIGLLPLPDDGIIEQSATNRVENVPEDPLDCVSP